MVNVYCSQPGAKQPIRIAFRTYFDSAGAPASAGKDRPWSVISTWIKTALYAESLTFPIIAAV
jgi:hypothetical protein